MGNQSGEIKCVLCHSDNSSKCFLSNDFFENPFEIRKCLTCKTYFLHPLPNESLLDKYYNESYFGKSGSKFKNPVIEKAIDYFRKSRARKLSKSISDRAKVLDIGCGNGNFLNYLSEFGSYELHGIERNELAAQRALLHTNLKVQSRPLDAKSFPENYFDAVTMFHVFEHVSNPTEVLTIISKILKSGGVFRISVPNIQSFQALIFKGNWLHIDTPRHLFFLKPDDMIKTIESYGFKVIESSSFSIEQNPFGAIQSILNLVFKKKDLLFEFFKGNYYYKRKIRLITDILFFVLWLPFFIFTDLVISPWKRGATIEYSFIKISS